MATGVNGTFVIRWSQTRIDGIWGAAEQDMRTGMIWRWSGLARRMDGPDGISRLEDSEGMQELHRRAAIKARKICGRVLRLRDLDLVDVDEDQLLDRGFVLTDGRHAYAASRVDAQQNDGALLMFLGELPPADTDLWIARITSNARADARARQNDLPVAAGLAAGTMIATPTGERPAETLQPGEPVLTRDDGVQNVLWVGMQRLSGARLHMAPHLRPIRIAAGVLGVGRPRHDLLVAPDHRLLLAGRRTGALFAEREVLVRARDLLDLPGVSRDLDMRSVTYVQLILGSHQILTAAGIACESFLPDAGARTVHLANSDTEDMPQLDDQTSYGPPARRCLSQGEAAILASGLI